jgi:hypothetical protein
MHLLSVLLLSTVKTSVRSTRSSIQSSTSAPNRLRLGFTLSRSSSLLVMSVCCICLHIHNMPKSSSKDCLLRCSRSSDQASMIGLRRPVSKGFSAGLLGLGRWTHSLLPCAVPRNKWIGIVLDEDLPVGYVSINPRDPHPYI